MKYTFLKKEDLPETLRDKPKWASFLIIASGLLILTLSAVSVGALLGYTYCYIEHRGIRIENVSQTSLNLPSPGYPDTEDARYNRTINGALMTSVLVSKLKMLGIRLLNNQISPRQANNNDTSASA